MFLREDKLWQSEWPKRPDGFMASNSGMKCYHAKSLNRTHNLVGQYFSIKFVNNTRS